MGVHKNSIQFPSDSGSVKDETTVSTFGNLATGFSSGFGRQTNSIFGTFPNQNNQQQSTNNNSAAFGSQNIFGNNFFHNPGFFQQHNFGFGWPMSQQTTNICFTGFGEPKTNYCFASSSFATMKKVTLVFEHPDIIFGSSIFRKPDTVVEIEAHPINNRTWTSNNNDFSFGVGHIEKYNSIFIMKSASPIKFSVKVKQPGFSFNNTMSSMNYGNRKITVTFQSNQPQYIPNTNILRPLETIVEIPLPLIKYDPISTFSNEDFMFSVGPTGASNSFEVETSKNAVFKVTFAETGKYNNNQLFGNRQTRTGSVFFDQGRQMNAFSTTSGPLFGGQAPTAFGASQSFGTSATGSNVLPSNQAQTINSSLFGTPSIGQGFGANQTFGNSTTDTAGKVDKSRPNGGGILFGQTNKSINSQQPAIGTENTRASVFGQVFGNEKPETGVVYFDQGQIDMNTFPTPSNQPTLGSSNSEACAFGAKQSLFTSPTTLTDDKDKVKKDLTSVYYQPTFGSDVLQNYLGRVQTKTNCITAMSEYENTSLEELRLQDYLRSACEPSKQNNMTIDPAGEREETANSATNNFTGGGASGYSPSQNKIGNTNQAFFDQLHQLIPYLNAGSFCKCVRSCNAAKPSQINSNSALASSSQIKTNSDSLDHLYVNTQKPRLNDNITIDEFYQDVFKYLEYIQKQYRHLESTLNNKNGNIIPEEHSNKSAAIKADESNRTSIQNTQKSPMPVFGCSTYAAANAVLNEKTSSIEPGPENDIPSVEKDSSIFAKGETNKSLLFRAGGASNKITLPTSKHQLEAGSEIEKKLSKVSFPFPTNSGNSDDAAQISETSKTEERSNESAKLKAEESNRNSTKNTKLYPMPVFGASTYSAVNTNISSSHLGTENNASTVVEKVSDIFGCSPLSAYGTTTAATKNNNNVEPTKSLLFGTGVNNIAPLGTSTPLEFPFSITSGSTDDTVKMKETHKTLDDHSNGIRASTTTTGNKTTGIGIFSPTAVTSSQLDNTLNVPIFSTTDTSFSSTVGEKSTGFLSLTFPSSKPEKPLTGSIFSTKDTLSSSTVGEKSISFFSVPSQIPYKTLTAPIFSTKDTSSSSTVRTNSIGLFSFAVPSKIPENTSAAPIFSIKDTNTSNTSGLIFPNTKPENTLTGSMFAVKDSTSSSTAGSKSTSLFSIPVSSQMSGKTLTAPIFSTKSPSSSSTVEEKSTGFFGFNMPTNKPDNMFTVPFLATKDTTSSSTAPGLGAISINFPSNKAKTIDAIESNAKTINVSNSDVAESTPTDSSTKENFQNESDNGGSSGRLNIVNIVKAVNSLSQSIISNDNTTPGGSSEEKIAPTQQIHEPMDVQGPFAPLQVFKMRKISDILADINECEVQNEDSLTESDTDSDISNYSLISNRSSKEDGKGNASCIQTEEHPTGIVMSRYGYYILPSLEDLKSQITEDGACVVPNFTIGRKGYGSVCFNKEINVAGLNVNDIVHFRNKEIIIYPNDTTNPQVVADLKKCDVLVTLEQVWPHNGTKHEPIKDPQHLDQIKYEDKLRLVCYKNDVHFVDYRPETGSWLFKMKQFTKHNINCWDVEDEDIVGNKSSTAEIPKIIKFKQPDKSEELGPPAKKISF